MAFSSAHLVHAAAGGGATSLSSSVMVAFAVAPVLASAVTTIVRVPLTRLSSVVGIANDVPAATVPDQASSEVVTFTDTARPLPPLLLNVKVALCPSVTVTLDGDRAIVSGLPAACTITGETTMAGISARSARIFMLFRL